MMQPPKQRPGQPRTMAEYSAYPAVNYSTLKYMAQSPLHYRHAVDVGTGETPAMLLGRATHTAVLEPERFPLEYVVWDGRRQGKDWEAFRDVNSAAGKTVLTTTEYETAMGISAGVRANPAAVRLLSRGRAEVMLTWDNPDTGLHCKGRVDWIASTDSGGIIVDLKTTHDISPRVFAAHAWRMKYFHQAAMYQEGYARTATGLVLPCILIAVESSPPHACTVYRLDMEGLAAAWDEYIGWLKLVRDCTDSGIWPGPDPELDLKAPAWAITDAEADFGGIGETE